EADRHDQGRGAKRGPAGDRPCDPGPRRGRHDRRLRARCSVHRGTNAPDRRWSRRGASEPDRQDGAQPLGTRRTAARCAGWRPRPRLMTRPIDGGLDFVVRRDDPRVHACWPAPRSRENDGQALLRIDRFGFTANNITYVTLGERLSYWSFFPTAEGWGRIPVWGFATVLESTCDGVETGARFFGYYPMSSHVLMEPTRVTPAGYVDGLRHRRELPALYNRYIRTTADPTYDEVTEPEHVLLRPLFITSYVVDDWLFDGALFGGSAVLVSSASSKVACGLAFLLAERNRSQGGTFEVIGLTSGKNRPFVERLGTY